MKYTWRSSAERLATGRVFLCTCLRRLSIWEGRQEVVSREKGSYLELRLAEAEVDWQHVVGEYFCKDADSALQFLVKRLEVVLVKL